MESVPEEPMSNILNYQEILTLKNNKKTERIIFDSEMLKKIEHNFTPGVTYNYELLGNLSEEILSNKVPLQIQVNPSFANISINNSPAAGMTIEAVKEVTADNIAEYAYPLAQFVQQVEPDYIIACDRGARLIGMAVHMLYRRLYGALPTRDHRISFRKITRKIPVEIVRDTLKADIERMLAETEHPTVLVLDDWIATGDTQNLVRKLFAELSGGRITVLYGVVTGGGADVTGDMQDGIYGDWDNRRDLIGVDYSENATQASLVHSKAALGYRRRMAAGIDKFVTSLAHAKPLEPSNV